MKPILYSVLIITFVLITVLIFDLVPTGMVATSVSITEQLDSLLYEKSFNDTTFQISFIANDSYHTYNSTSDGTKSGLDIGASSNNFTEFFTLVPITSIEKEIDVTIKSEDFNNGNNDGNFIDVDQNNGDVQIFIPSIGWRNIPDGSSTDADSSKDTTELCIANNLTFNSIINGFDFRIRSSSINSDSYLAEIKIAAYNVFGSFDPCSSVGEYVVIE